MSRTGANLNLVANPDPNPIHTPSVIPILDSCLLGQGAAAPGKISLIRDQRRIINHGSLNLCLDWDIGSVSHT